MNIHQRTGPGDMESGFRRACPPPGSWGGGHWGVGIEKAEEKQKVSLNPKGCWDRERKPWEAINIITSQCLLALQGVFDFSTFKTSVLRIISRFYLQYFSHPEEHKATHFSCRMLSRSAFAVSGCQGDFIIMKVLSGKGLRTQPPTNTWQRGQNGVGERVKS